MGAPVTPAEPTSPGAGRRGPGCLVQFAAALLLLALAGAAGLWGVQRYLSSKLAPDPVTIASASLEGLREQNRLSAFAARFVAVVTSRRTQLGFSTEKTLIMPGLVRYEVDLAKLTQRDVSWDPATKVLSVRLPPIEIDGPQVDLNAVREYGTGGVLARLTDAGQALDAANRRAGQAELIRQARDAMPMRLARDATRRAVERSFAMPLRATGLDATVRVRFADEPVPSTERWDVSRSLDEVMQNRR